MAIPLRKTNLKLSTSWPSHIVIHHTACKLDIPPVSLDRPTFQAQKYELMNAKILKKPGATGFNFIVEKTGNDFSVIVSQPLMSLCEFQDIPESYYKSIHIALLGNYNIEVPKKRIYLVLAYRLLVPLMRMFYIRENEIITHESISEDKHFSCPGINFNMSTMLLSLRTVMKRQMVSRKK